MKKLSLLNCLLLLFYAFSIAFGQTPGDRVLKKEIEIEKGQYYLNLPVKNSERLVRTTIRLNGKPLDQFTINLASSDPDFWTFFDVTPYQGKTLVIEVANVPARQFNMGSGNATQPELKQHGLNLVHADSKHCIFAQIDIALIVCCKAFENRLRGFLGCGCAGRGEGRRSREAP